MCGLCRRRQYGGHKLISLSYSYQTWKSVYLPYKGITLESEERIAHMHTHSNTLSLMHILPSFYSTCIPSFSECKVQISEPTRGKETHSLWLIKKNEEKQYLLLSVHFNWTESSSEPRKHCGLPSHSLDNSKSCRKSVLSLT